MKCCRLKIITACINPEEKESDKEIIQYVSQTKKFISGYQTEYNSINYRKEEMEEEKNIIEDEQKEEEEEEAIIIRDKNDLIKKIPKINKKEKIYLIDGLFSSSNNIIKKNLFKNPNEIKNLNNSKARTKEKNNQKLFSAKNAKINNKKNEKIITQKYKLEPKFDNKTNTFYTTKINKNSSAASPIKTKDAEKIFHAPDNPFVFNFYKTNKEIDHNITGLYDYKKRIKELLDQEPKKILDRDNIMKENNPKIEDLLKENTKLNFELGFEINREDELKGEIIILKNQYEILFDLLTKEEIKIKQFKDIIKHKEDHEKIIMNKQNEIINYYNALNDCLEKREILLINKPDLFDKFIYLNSKNIEEKTDIINENNENHENNKYSDNKDINNDDENKNQEINLKTNLEIINEIDKNNEIDSYLNYDIITLLLKGYFINMNLKNVNEIVDQIWIYEKPIQTFESLTEELLMLIDNYISAPNSTFNNMHNRNIIMNYLYSFCNCYNYMTKNEFISIFTDKLGDFIEFNENYLMNKLYQFCHGKLDQFLEILIHLNKQNNGKFSIHQLIKALKEKNLIINNNYNENLNQINEQNLIYQKEIIDLFQLLIIEMKKKGNKKIVENEKEINIYELYIGSIINIIKENKNSDTPLYKGLIKKYLVDNNIKSMLNFMEPLLINHDIIINKGLKRYLKNDTFNNFLISKNVIGENETFIIPYNDESLIEINQLVKEIDEANPVLNNFEENKEKLINDIINDIDNS